MQAVSTQKFIHTSPRKLRLVADMIRKMEPTQALLTLQFTPKDAAKELSAAIKTALANASQKGMDSSVLLFEKIEVNEGPRMRRYRAGTRGRTKPYKRRMSHIKVVLSDDLKVKSEIKNVKTEEKVKKVEAKKETK